MEVDSILSQDEVVKCFFKIFYNDQDVDSSHIKDIYIEAETYHKKGWRYQDICNGIVYHHKQKNDRPESISDINILNIKTPPLKKEGNLLKDRFYFHRRLHNQSKASSIHIDNDGKLIKKEYPFYLEIVNYFSIEDINNYFISKMKINDKMMIDKNKKTISYMVNNYELDIILFSIDYAYNFLESKNYKKFRNIRNLVDYIDSGIDLLNEVKNVSIDHVHPYYKAYLIERGG